MLPAQVAVAALGEWRQQDALVLPPAVVVNAEPARGRRPTQNPVFVCSFGGYSTRNCRQMLIPEPSHAN
jgi:hypothetical protein